MRDNNGVEQAAQSRRGWMLTVAVGLAIIGIIVALFLSIGRWLVIEDPLEKADAIVVLSGKMPQRALEAARLYKEGYSPQIWLTRSDEPAASLQKMHIAFIGEDFYDTQILMHEGVPSNAVHVLEPSILNTADELRAVDMELRMTGGSKVIIVTSKAHTRRVRTLWRKQGRGAARAVIRAASTDGFEPAQWWRRTGDALDVVRETLGLLNAWAGLPLKPAE